MNNQLHGIKAAIFDLDGTLFDSTHLWADIDDEFLSRRGRVTTADYKRGIAALGNRECARFTIEYYGLTDTEEELISEWTEMARQAYMHTIRLFPGVQEYLRDCHSRGVRLFAVTSLLRELACACLDNNGVLGLFEDIFTVDEVGIIKSEPGIYVHAAQKAGVLPCECVVMDDVAVAVRAAHLAGMRTVAVRGEHSYNDGTDIFDGTADLVAESVTAVTITP